MQNSKRDSIKLTEILQLLTIATKGLCEKSLIEICASVILPWINSDARTGAQKGTGPHCSYRLKLHE